METLQKAVSSTRNNDKRTWVRSALMLVGACAVLANLASNTGVLKDVSPKYEAIQQVVQAQVQEAIQQAVQSQVQEAIQQVVQQEQLQQQPVQQQHVLPQCKDLMKRHSFLQDGAFLTRQDTQVAWTLRADGSRELTLPHTCQLKRYSAQEARTCLAHQHVLTIGDSLTRYQSLGLMYFLEHGHHPARFPKVPKNSICAHINEQGEPQCGLEDEKNVCLEKEQGGWQNFHQHIGDKAGPFHGHLECSCLRPGGPPGGPNEDTESLLYRNYNVSVSHMSEVGWDVQPKMLKGFDFTGCAVTGSCTLSHDDIQKRRERSIVNDWDWNATLSDTGFDVLKERLGQVDITFYNRGNWNQMTTKMAKDLMTKFRDLATDRCYYKSTTASPRTRSMPHMRPVAEMDRVFVETVKAGCGYMDYAHVTSAFDHYHENRNKDNAEFRTVFWDVVHYLPWVYEELNNVLLNVLCNAK